MSSLFFLFTPSSASFQCNIKQFPASLCCKHSSVKSVSKNWSCSEMSANRTVVFLETSGHTAVYEIAWLHFSAGKKPLKRNPSLQFLSLTPEENSLHIILKFPSKLESYKGAWKAYVVVMLVFWVSIHHQMLCLATGDMVFMVIIWLFHSPR